jgi:ABC-type antimicrobial peptide transport system permease subunit
VTLWLLVALVTAGLLPFVYGARAKPGARQLALRSSTRRPRQTLLVVLGAVLSTAIVTSAGVVGESLRASVRRSAVTQLGPVDEEIVGVGPDRGPTIESAVDRARLSDIDGTLPLVAMVATVRGRDFVARVAQAQVVEVDFPRAERFGGYSSETGISGPTPTAGTAVISADLSDAIAIVPGHRVTISAFGTARTFRVARVLPRLGVAGLATPLSPPGSESLNLFVPPGTLAAMLPASASQPGSAQAMPLSIVAISNTGRESGDARKSAAVTTELRAATAALDTAVHPVKQQLLDDADHRSRSFTELFRAFGIFGALAGLLLLVLTFSILTRERGRSMGILRAQGLSRRDMVLALGLEGAAYTIVGVAIGVLGGLALAAGVVAAARGVFNNPTSGAVDLIFSARSATVATAGALGFIVAFAVVIGTAFVAARRNIVRVMRRLPDPPDPRRSSALVSAGVLVSAVGLATTVIGLVVTNAAAIVGGPAMFALGVVLILNSPTRARGLVSIASAATIGWSLLAITVEQSAFARLGAGVIVTEGLVLCSSALALSTVNYRALTRPLLASNGRRGMVLTLGLAYARTAPRRTMLITAMYATVIFTFTFLVTIGQLYKGDTNDLARRLGGTSALEVTSNPADPIAASEIAQVAGVDHVAATVAIPAQLQTASANRSAVTSGNALDVTLVGFDETFIGHGSPRLTTNAPQRPDQSVYRAVAADPTAALVGADLNADRLSGFASGRLRVGDRIVLRNQTTGIARTLKVAGLVTAARYGGSDHIYVARTVVDQLLGAGARPNLLFVETPPGINDDVLAAVIDGTHLANGTYARSFRKLARANLSTQQQFLDISSGYTAIGLAAGVAGIAILMADRVRERRQQISILRAFGFPAKTLSRALQVETATIAIDATIIGTISALLLVWRLSANGGLAQPLPFRLPVLTILAIAVIVLTASLLATWRAARLAARVLPAVALRAHD